MKTKINTLNTILIPFGKFELGLTQLSDYTDFSASSVSIYDSLTFKTGNISTGLKFDSVLYLEDKTLSRNGFIEYIYDFTPDIDYFYKSNTDNKTYKKTVSAYSLHNIKGNIGFEYARKSGSTFAINYEKDIKALMKVVTLIVYYLNLEE